MSLFSKKSPLKKSVLTKKRSLRMEPLEERQMLAVTPGFESAHFDNLVAAYPSLATNWLDYDAYAVDQSVNNIQVIDVSEIGDATNAELQTQLNAAMATGNNIIVLMVDNVDVAYDLTQALSLSGNATLSVVVLNVGAEEGSFQLNASGNARHFNISGANTRAQFGGIEFTHVDANGDAIATNGGGFNITGGTVNFESVEFAYCQSTMRSQDGNNPYQGGAIYMTGTNTSVTVSSASFIGNAAPGNSSQGGAVYQNQGTFRAYNTLFADNNAAQGGAVYTVGGGASTTIVNATVANNAGAGFAIYNNATQTTTAPQKNIYNSVFTGNSGNRDVFLSQPGTRNVANVVRTDGSIFDIPQTTITGVNDFVANVGLVNYRPTAESAVVNRIADTQYLPPAYQVIDADGNQRLVGGRLDIGAFEFQESTEYRTTDFIKAFDLSKDAPVVLEHEGDFYWTFTVNIFEHDTYSNFPTTVVMCGFEDGWYSGDAGLIRDNGDGTVTFFWNYQEYGDATVPDGQYNEFSYYTAGDVAGPFSNTSIVRLSVLSPEASAGFYGVVTTLDDLDFGDFDPTVPNSHGDWILSLRQAIYATNNRDIVNATYEIDLGDGNVNILFAPYLDSGTIYLDDGQLVIRSSVTIVGLGAGNLTIDAREQSRIFDIANFERDPVTTVVTRPDVQLQVAIS
ncbi:MAG: hypothetical protein FWD31_11715, partial [Planctomycetaceae bacterium]|nr:hypothetical protein [Planctomycetaceae bacterium]